MMTRLLGGMFAAAVVAGSAGPALAQGGFSLSIGGPVYGGYHYAPPPVYYAPPPVYRPAVVVPHYGHYDVYPSYGYGYGYGGHFHHHHHGHGNWGGYHGHGHHDH